MIEKSFCLLVNPSSLLILLEINDSGAILKSRLIKAFPKLRPTIAGSKRAAFEHIGRGAKMLAIHIALRNNNLFLNPN
jgi:hypothetical protein